MQQLNTLLDHNINTLLLAPTGWGKTTLLLDLVKNSQKSWVYLAPLRALANEFYIRASKYQKGVFLISHYHELKSLMESGSSFKLLIITPELISSDFINLYNGTINYVFDEIHLFYYWGQSFRPKLLDCYEEVMAQEGGILALTATMGEGILRSWEAYSELRQSQSYKIEIKNHTLKKDPKLYIYVPKAFKKNIINHMCSHHTEYSKLIFCSYREEVLALERFFRSQGFSVISCIGGETHLLAAKLEQCKRPDFIIGTSAISHGVNLPKISMIYLSYKVENYDFWIQMIGRGGRQGEEFKVYSMDKYRISWQSWILSWLYLLTLRLWQKIYPHELRRYFNSQNSI